MEAFVEHEFLPCFLINIHSFHNVHLLRSVLLHNLTAPIAYSANRHADHNVYASQLHGTQETKQKKTAEKRKMTEAAKKEKCAEGGPSKRTRLDVLPTELDIMDTT